MDYTILWKWVQYKNYKASMTINEKSQLYIYKYFNKKYDLEGYLFQGNNFSEIIKDDAQLLETSSQVYLNPVRADIVEKPVDYKWSTYKMYIAKEKVELLELDIILYYFNYEKEA